MGSQFQIEETTIGDIHAAYKAHTLTAEALVAAYIDRINKIDKAGPTINSIISVNPKALEAAKELDAEFAENGISGTLHGIPIVVKDQVKPRT